MANIKVSQMGAAAALTGAELVPVVQGGANKRTTIGAIIPPGGTTGQILSKVNNTSFNTQWVDPPAGGGGGDYTVVATSFAANSIAGNVTTPADLASVAIPANTLTGVRKLVMETYLEITTLTSGENLAQWDISVRVGAVVVTSKVMPVSSVSNGFFAGGILKIRTEMQAGNVANVQYNNVIVEENVDNNSAGGNETVAVMAFSLTSPVDWVTAIDMTTAQTYIVRAAAISSGGDADVTLRHRYTRIDRIGA